MCKEFGGGAKEGGEEEKDCPAGDEGEVGGRRRRRGGVEREGGREKGKNCAGVRGGTNLGDGTRWRREDRRVYARQ